MFNAKKQTLLPFKAIVTGVPLNVAPKCWDPVCLVQIVTNSN